MSVETMRLDGQNYRRADNRSAWTPATLTPEELAALPPAPPLPPPPAPPPPPTIGDIKRLLDQVRTAEKLSARDGKIVATANAEREVLLRGFDLDNARDVAALTRFNVVTSCGPARVALRREEEMALKEELSDLVVRFARGPFYARLTELESSALKTVEPKLRDMYREGDAIRHAALQTALLQSLGEIREAASVTVSGREYAVREAEKIIKTWGLAEQFAGALK